MIAIRPACARGSTQRDAAASWHSFSFGDYYDPAHMGFGALRVLNEITLAPAAGVAPETHANMEILTWVVAGGLRDEVSGIELKAGDLQCLSAGRGVAHAESNASAGDPARYLQFWIQPDRVNAEPRTSKGSFTAGTCAGLRLIAAANAGEHVVPIRGDTRVHVARLTAGQRIAHALCLGRRAWLQVTKGVLELNGVRLAAGDGAAALHENRIELLGIEDAEALVFDLPGQ